MTKRNIRLLIVILLLSLCCERSYSQTTQFTYQGSLTVGGAVADGSFDFEFLLFDAPTGGTTDTIVGRPTGGTISFREANIEEMRINPGGTIRINALGSAGATELCRNANFELSICSSSIRYKTNVNAFGSGLDLISRLRPVSFNWRAGGPLDLRLSPKR